MISELEKLIKKEAEIREIIRKDEIEISKYIEALEIFYQELDEILKEFCLKI